jgi:hypothetical protein
MPQALLHRAAQQLALLAKQRATEQRRALVTRLARARARREGAQLLAAERRREASEEHDRRVEALRLQVGGRGWGWAGMGWGQGSRAKGRSGACWLAGGCTGAGQAWTADLPTQ